MLQAIGDSEEVTVKVNIFGEKMWVPVDTAALSIWIDWDWFVQNGETLLTTGHGTAEAVDVDVGGQGVVEFELWGKRFKEIVKVLGSLPDRLLIDRKFWRKNKLRLDLSANYTSITVDGACHEGSVGRSTSSEGAEGICRVLEGDDVDHYLKQEADYSQFSNDQAVRQKITDLLWRKRAIFKGLGCIKGVKHEIVLKKGVRPICQSLHRRSPK